MSELNLPEEFRKLQGTVESKPKKNLVLCSKEEVRKLLTALSDARNKLTEKNTETVALNVTLENREAELDEQQKINVTLESLVGEG